MAQIGITHSVSGFTGYALFVIYKASAPTTEVARSSAEALPVSGLVATFPNLDPVVYIIKLYQSSNGTSLDTLIEGPWSIDASIGDANGGIDIFTFVVGDGQAVGDGTNISPVDGATAYVNTNLAASDVITYQVDKPGYGQMSFRTQLDRTSSGGFSYKTSTPLTFKDGEEYTVTVYKKGITQSAPAAQFAGVFDFTSNFTFGASHYNKLIAANLSSTVGVITLNALGSYPADKFLHVTTHGGAQNFVKIVCNGAETISFNGAFLGTIILGKGEEIKIYFDGTKAYVVAYSGDANLVGTVRYGYKQQANELPLDGGASAGATQDYLIADYPRIKAFMDTLPTGRVLTGGYTQWGSFQTATYAGGLTKTVYPNKGFFAISADGLRFRVPDFRDMSVITSKFYDTTSDSERITQGAGGFQTEDVHVQQDDTSGQGSPVTGTATNLGYKGDDPSHAQFRIYKKEIKTSANTKTRTDNYGLPAFLKI